MNSIPLEVEVHVVHMAHDVLGQFDVKTARHVKRPCDYERRGGWERWGYRPLLFTFLAHPTEFGMRTRMFGRYPTSRGYHVDVFGSDNPDQGRAMLMSWGVKPENIITRGAKRIEVSLNVHREDTDTVQAAVQDYMMDMLCPNLSCPDHYLSIPPPMRETGMAA